MTASTHKTSDERKEALARSIAGQIAGGGRVESQSDFQAVVVKGKPVNHVLHLILTLISFPVLFAWAIVWLILVITGGEKRQMINVDEWGNVNVAKL